MKMSFLDTKRFIKKVPPSGGAPAYKLTLPHQVVHRHLLHLVDVDFELAPVNDAQQTWSGSIVPRRNKDRSEYTLQGWKLFAQAHNIQAGDQVSFELVTPRRLVLQVLNLEIQPSVLIRKSCESEVAKQDSPQKSSRLSPSNLFGLPSFSEPSSFSEDPLDSLLSGGALEDADAVDEQWRSMSNSSIHLADISQKASNKHLENYSLSDQIVPETPSSAKSSLELFHTPLKAKPTKVNSAFSTGFPPCPTRPERKEPNTTSIFHDLLQDMPTHDLAHERCDSPQKVPYHFDQSFELIDSPPPTSQLTMPESDICSTVDFLNTDSFALKREMVQEAPKTSTALQLVQRRLDEQTREALRAVLGLEQCAMTLSNLHNEPGNVEAQNTHMNMFKMLEKLKGNLWRMLVLTLSDDVSSM